MPRYVYDLDISLRGKGMIVRQDNFLIKEQRVGKPAVLGTEIVASSSAYSGVSSGVD